MMNRDQSQNQGGLDSEVQRTLNSGAGNQSAGGNMAKDPVCGGMVDKRTARDTLPGSLGTNMETLYFCSADCKSLFEQNPERYGYKNL
jgi:YHS domain-containing protein